MTWVVFPDRASFDAYHLSQCTAHGIPKAGYRQSDGQVQVMQGWTDAYVDIFGAFVASPNSFLLVNVPAADVATFGLTLSQNAPVVNPVTGQRTVVWDGTSHPVLTVAKDWQQPKPATWKDPISGITYNTTTGQPV